jgi:hypothetical protein
MQDAAANDGPPVDEIQCLMNALGPRRGFTRGVGRQVKQPSLFSFFSAGGSSSSQTNDRFAQLEEEIRKLREEVAELKGGKDQGNNNDEGDEDDGDGM